MREIKFRAWDGKRMIYFSNLMIGIESLKKSKGAVNPYVYFKDADFGGQVSMAKHEVMQYTGLKDKNGIEIYEGDRVLKNQHNIKSEYTVTWLNGGFIGMSEDRDDWGPFTCQLYNNLRFLEVIGNIYEPLTP
jgi:uncharacterized phage protein (TIGR01671 family)